MVIKQSECDKMDLIHPGFLFRVFDSSFSRPVTFVANAVMGLQMSLTPKALADSGETSPCVYARHFRSVG